MQTLEVIKRYNNRKLYSTKISKYVDQTYLLDLVKTSQKFVVMDNETSKDITTRELKKALIKLPLSKELMEVLIKGNSIMFEG